MKTSARVLWVGMMLGLQACTHMPSPPAALSGLSLYADVQRYEAFGPHRYGSPGADQAFDWLAAELRAAGLAVQDQAFVMERQYELRSASLHVAGQRIDVLPQWWLPDASATFALEAPIVASGPAPGAFVRLNLRYDQGAYLNASHKQALQAAFDRHPAAVLLTIDHPSGEVYTYNVAQDDAPWPVPVILVAPRHAALLDAAQASGQAIQLRVDGQHRQRVAGRNVIARLDRGRPQTVVVSTPVTGWHINACERGPGIAGFLALAREAESRWPEVNVVFIATAGHEIGHGGMGYFLHDAAPPPAQVAAWAHFGASLACFGWTRQDGQWVSDGMVDSRIRLVNASASMAPLLQQPFAAIEGRRLVGQDAAIGELREVYAAGYKNFFGMAGAHTFFHTTADTSAGTSPAALVPVVKAFAEVLDSVARQAGR